MKNKKIKANEISRSLLSIKMLLTVLIILLIWNNEIVINQGFFIYYWPKTEADVTRFWCDIITSSGFSPISAALPGIPFAYSLLEERNSGYLRMELTRQGVGRYIVRRIMVILITGFLVMFIPFLLEQILFDIVCSPTTVINHEPAYESLMWVKVIYLMGGKVYVVMQGLLFGLYGALWAVIDVFVSLFMRNKYMALIIPYVINQVIWNLGIWQLNTELLWRGDTFGNNLVRPYLLYMLVILLISSMIVFCFKIQIKKGKF